MKRALALSLAFLTTMSVASSYKGTDSFPGTVVKEGSANVAADIAKKIGIDQKLGTTIPKDLSFRDEEGKEVKLGDFLGKGPVVLALVYYECPSLCGMLMSGLFRGLKEVSLEPGKEFRAVFVSINPKEKAPLAAGKKASFVKHYGLSGSQAGVSMLTGEQPQITALAKAVGFRYEYDPTSKQYAHPGAAIILTPEGTISRYHFGVEFPGKDLRLSIVNASGNRIGSPIDHFLLYCYRFDPATGKYGLAILNSLRVGGVMTLAGMAAFIFFLSRGRRRKMTVRA